jgi:hypothetical protein
VELWLGPVLVAAVVSGLVNVLGWVVTYRSTRKLDAIRRQEKVQDFQIALRAEIASDLLNLEVIDRTAYLTKIRSRYASDATYSVVVPHMATNPVFDSVVKEIHILPAAVIEPVVHYARLRQTVEHFVLDLRAPGFSKLAADRQLAMYADYLDMLDRLEALAQNANDAITRSLNIRDEVPSTRQSGPERGGASAGKRP